MGDSAGVAFDAVGERHYRRRVAEAEDAGVDRVGRGRSDHAGFQRRADASAYSAVGVRGGSRLWASGADPMLGSDRTEGKGVPGSVNNYSPGNSRFPRKERQQSPDLMQSPGFGCERSVTRRR